MGMTKEFSGIKDLGNNLMFSKKILDIKTK